MEQQKIRKSILVFALVSSLIIILLLTTLFQSKKPAPSVASKKPKEEEAQTNLSQPKQQQGHFLVQTPNNPAAIQSKSEEYYGVIPQLTGLPSGETLELNQITIKIFENKEEYVKETGKPSWSEGFADYKNKEIFLINNDGLANSILPHEISHLFFDSYMNYESNDFNWLDEGLATLVQVKYDPDQADSFNQAISSIRSGTYIPLKELPNFTLDKQSAASQVNLYYAEVLSITSYLTSEWQRWGMLLEKLKSKESFTQSLKEAYEEDLASLEQKWLSYLEKNKQSWEK